MKTTRHEHRGHTGGRAAKALAALGAGALLFMASAGSAFAHVNPDPPAAEQGTSATIDFQLEHGCGNSPTNSLAFQIPAGVTNVKPVDKAGWQSAVNGDTVTFSGGKQDAHTQGDFSLSMTMPATAGTIYFKVVQTCDQGKTNWIEIPQAGQPEPQTPAAAVKVTAGPPTADDLKPADTGDDDAAASSSGGGSNTGLIVGLVAAAVVVIGGGGGLLAIRRRRAHA